MKKRKNTYLITDNNKPLFVITTKKDGTLSKKKIEKAVTLFYESLNDRVYLIDIDDYNIIIEKYCYGNINNIETIVLDYNLFSNIEAF